MNIGKIDKIFTGELVVSYQYKDDNIKEEYLIHPFYKDYKWEVGSAIKFEYSKECQRHYPISCVCKNMRTYALPILEKKKGLMDRLFGLVRKKK